MLSYKNIPFEHPLKRVEIHYAGPPRVPSRDVENRVKAAYEKGKQEATDELNEYILHNRQEVQQLLGETLEKMDKKVETCLRDIFDEIPALVTNIARRVLADVELDGEKIKAIVDDVIGDLPTNREQVEIYLCPKDLSQFLEYIDNPEKEYPHCRFREDPGLGPADCRVESTFGAIDARVETKLKHIEDQLRS